MSVSIPLGSPTVLARWYDVFAVAVAVTAVCIDGHHLDGIGFFTPGKATTPCYKAKMSLICGSGWQPFIERVYRSETII